MMIGSARTCMLRATRQRAAPSDSTCCTYRCSADNSQLRSSQHQSEEKWRGYWKGRGVWGGEGGEGVRGGRGENEDEKVTGRKRGKG